MFEVWVMRESCINEGLIEGREMCEGSGEEGRLYMRAWVRVKKERYLKSLSETGEVIAGLVKRGRYLFEGKGKGKLDEG